MILLLSLLLLFFGCEKKEAAPQISFFNGTEMTIDYSITVGAALSPEESQEVNRLIKEVFKEVDALYNKWNPNSELSHLNQLKSGQHFPLSPKLEKLLVKTDELVRLTHGKFDPTIEPIQQLWKQRLKEGREPNDEEIKALLPAIGWDKIHIANGFFWKDHDTSSLDLGGIAKGYCVDLLVEKLNATGYRNVLVEWGGEIRASGQHPDKRPWKIFISRLGDPDPSHAIATVELHDQAIATSGDYMQFWKVTLPGGGERLYFHIINPTTYRPLIATTTSIASVSVLASTCTFADGIAKVGMMFPTVKEAEKWADEIHSQYPDTQFWFLTHLRINASKHPLQWL